MYGEAGNDRMAGGDDDDDMDGGTGDDTLCGDTQVLGDLLLDGDTDVGLDILYAHQLSDMGVYCGNTSTRYDCRRWST